MLLSNAYPITMPRASNPPGHPRPTANQLVDFELSAVGQYLARHYGMFAWRIYPLIRAHNAFAGLDASFRRLDMFMYSPRAGMLYHELIIFVDHTIFSQATWQMYAARTRVCDLSDSRHGCFWPIDGECDSAEEWQNCLQWDALMARVLSTAYMRRAREVVVQRWDADAREYWRRGEGLSDPRADRVAKAVLAYGRESPVELTFEDMVSPDSEVDLGIQNSSEPTYDSDEEEDSFFEDEFGCIVDLSSCGPHCECGWDEDAGDQGAEVDSILYEFDFKEELRAEDRDIGRGLDFKCDGEFGSEFDFGSLDSVLSDATPPPASLTPSSSESSEFDADSEYILYPRIMPSPTLIPRQSNSRFLELGPETRTRTHPSAIEESPSFATSSSSDSERILADFSALSLSLSGRTSMNILDGESILPSRSKPASGFTPQSVEARTHEPSLLDLALGLGTQDSEERLRKREFTSSSSYPSPPPSPSLQLPGDRCPEAAMGSSTVPVAKGKPEVRGTSSSQSKYTYCPPPSPSPFSASAACDANRILPNATHASRLIELTPTFKCHSSGHPAGDTMSVVSTQSPSPSRKLRVTLSLTFRNPPPPASPAPVEPATPRVRTAFSLWDAIMRPQAAPAQPLRPRLAGVNIPAGDPIGKPNPPMPVDYERKAPCGQCRSLDELPLGDCATEAAEAGDFVQDVSDSERELVSTVKKTRRGGEKARRQRERRRARIEMADAWDAEWRVLAGLVYSS